MPEPRRLLAAVPCSPLHPSRLHPTQQLPLEVAHLLQLPLSWDELPTSFRKILCTRHPVSHFVLLLLRLLPHRELYSILDETLLLLANLA